MCDHFVLMKSQQKEIWKTQSQNLSHQQTAQSLDFDQQLEPLSSRSFRYRTSKQATLSTEFHRHPNDALGLPLAPDGSIHRAPGA